MANGKKKSKKTFHSQEELDEYIQAKKNGKKKSKQRKQVKKLEKDL